MDGRVVSVLKAVVENWQDYDDAQGTFAFTCHFCALAMDEHYADCVVQLARQLLAEDGMELEE